jgi:hypothetical protein
VAPSLAISHAMLQNITRDQGVESSVSILSVTEILGAFIARMVACLPRSSDRYPAAAFRIPRKLVNLLAASRPAWVSPKTSPSSAGTLLSREISLALRQASKSARSNGAENLRPMLSVNCREPPSARFCQIPWSSSTTWPFSSTMRAKRSIDGTYMPSPSSLFYVPCLNGGRRLKFALSCVNRLQICPNAYALPGVTVIYLAEAQPAVAFTAVMHDALRSFSFAASERQEKLRINVFTHRGRWSFSRIRRSRSSRSSLIE